MKDYNVMIDKQNFFDQLVKNNVRAYNKITTGQGDDYKSTCLLFHPFFNEHYKMIAINLSKQQALHDNPKAIQQINQF